MVRHISKKILIESGVALGICFLLLLVIIPHFLQAQVRSKVATTCRRLDQVRIALNTYRVEHDFLPIPDYCRNGYFYLTSPIPYLQSIDICIDPFLQEAQKPITQNLTDIMFLSVGLHHQYTRHPEPIAIDFYGHPYLNVSYILWSIGPSLYTDFGWAPGLVIPLEYAYSPTNGLNSLGNLYAIDHGLLE